MFLEYLVLTSHNPESNKPMIAVNTDWIDQWNTLKAQRYNEHLDRGIFIPFAL